MINVILYNRVSSDDQIKNFSIENQIELNTDYAKRMGWNVVSVIEDDGYSAKNFDRPGWKKLKDIVYGSKIKVHKVYFVRWDRFGRNTEFCLRVIRQFGERGTEINAVQQPIDFGTPISKHVLNTYLTTGEVERDNIRIRTSEGIRKSLREGYWPNHAPIGYSNYKINGRGSLIKNENAEVIVFIFEEYSKGLFSQDEIRIMVRRKFGVKIPKSTMMELLRRVVYAGKVYSPAYGDKPAKLVDSIHEPIISMELFSKVQTILKGRRPVARMPKLANDRLPLRGKMTCPSCGKNLTGSGSKSRNGSIIYYYHCQRPCKIRFNAQRAEGDLIDLLKSYSPPMEQLELFKMFLLEELEESKRGMDQEARRISTELKKKKEELELAEIRVFNGELSQAIFDKVSTKHQESVEQIESRLFDLNNCMAIEKEWIDGAVKIVGNLSHWYRSSDFDTKTKLLGSIFAENLLYDGNNYRTSKISPLIRLFNPVKGDLEPKKGSPKEETPVQYPGPESNRHDREIIGV